nr:hypothetical protein [Paramyrothecium sp.]
MGRQSLWSRLSVASSIFDYAAAAAMPPRHLRVGPVSMNPYHSFAAKPLLNPVPRQDESISDDWYDPEDFSHITKMAAIGDSYSAGIGAGDRLGGVFEALDPTSDYACSRYNHAYPYLLHTDSRFGDEKSRKFQFRSCSGDTTKEVLDTQIPALDSDQQLILLSVGGNDVQLVNILNQCIYQWGVLNQEQVEVAKIAALADPKYEWAESFDWDTLGRGCEGQLDHTESIINSDAFSSSIDKVLEAAKGKLADDGTIYYTGYAKFFNEEYSSECDSVSWSTWVYKAYNIFQKEAKLTSDNRRRMNDLVDAVNKKLIEAVERAGDKVKFIDYDSLVGEFGGRYCEPGVDEATSESNSRDLLMFYELNSWDPLGNTPRKRSNDDPLNDTFQGNVNIFAEITLLADPKAELVHKDKVEGEASTAEIAQVALSEHSKAVAVPVAGAATSSTGLLSTTAEFQVPNILPDGYGRVFHPQILLHEIIAEQIIFDMMNVNLFKKGWEESPRVLEMDSCPVIKKPVNPLTCERPQAGNTAFGITMGDDAVNKACGWKDMGLEGFLVEPSMAPIGNIQMRYDTDGTFDRGISPSWVESTKDYCGVWPGGTCSNIQGGFVMYMTAQFDDAPANPDDCPPATSFQFPSGDECKRIYHEIIHGCNTDTISDKQGGTLRVKGNYVSRPDPKGHN